MRHMTMQMAKDLGSTLAKATNALGNQLLSKPTTQGSESAAATGAQNTPQVRASS